MQSFVAIKWIDSEELPGWNHLDDVANERADPITTIGILLREPTEEDPFYVVCRDACAALGKVAGVNRIPEGAVVRVDEFEWPEGF